MLAKLELELRLRGFSRKTVKAYVYHVEKFEKFVKKDLKKVRIDDIRNYVNKLISKHNKPATVNLAISSLRFFYRKVLHRKIADNVKRLKKEEKIPIVLTKDEIESMINVVSYPKHKLLIELLYGSGLRVSECVNLKINDLFLDEKKGVVIKGKGSKDRLFILSEKFIEDLKRYLDYRKDDNPYVFNSKFTHIRAGTAEKIVKNAARKACIKKNVYPHVLRASFATDLLDHGTELHVIQKLLGHKRINTTQLYIKASNKQLKEVKSPLD